MQKIAGSPRSCPSTYCSIAPMKLPRCLRPVGWMPEKITVMRTGQGIRRRVVGLSAYRGASRRATLPVVKKVLRPLGFHASALVLGTLWFCVLVTAWATGIGLLITLLGLPVIWLTLVLAREMAEVEVHLARGLLDADVAAPP